MAAKPWLVVPLVLPVGDKEYAIQPIEYDGGLELINVLLGRHDTIKANSADEPLMRLTMGPVWDEMKADRLPFNVMFRAGMAATSYQAALVNDMSTDEAVKAGEKMWESGINPEALAAALTAAAKKVSDASTTSPATPRPARRSSTKPRASTANTSTTRARANRSSGTPSSTSGI